MRLVEQPYGILVGQRLESFADQAHAHVDLVQACQPLKELSERCCVLHGPVPPWLAY